MTKRPTTAAMQWQACVREYGWYGGLLDPPPPPALTRRAYLVPSVPPRILSRAMRRLLAPLTKGGTK